MFPIDLLLVEPGPGRLSVQTSFLRVVARPFLSRGAQVGSRLLPDLVKKRLWPGNRRKRRTRWFRRSLCRTAAKQAGARSGVGPLFGTGRLDAVSPPGGTR